MRVATWNINSVRLRLPLIERFVRENKPDILCLQETKVVNDAFPEGAFEQMGFAHRAISGMKSYNGVAILSKIPFAETGVLNWQGKEDCRHIFAKLAGGPEIHCVYIPAGGDVPDPAANPKFAHKLGFLDDLAAYWRGRDDKAAPKMMLGDFNIAPLENDVWSHKQLLDVVSHTPLEVEKLLALQTAHDWIDAPRRFVPESKKLYSWWSYRARDWTVGDRGRRLDHIWITPSLLPQLQATGILKAARGWDPKPSDHVPVWADFSRP